MLFRSGDIVELGFETETGTDVETGQVIGWIEGFKAVTDIFSPLSGRFDEFNPALDKQIQLLTSDPYDKGWLFKIRGNPGDDCHDASPRGTNTGMAKHRDPRVRAIVPRDLALELAITACHDFPKRYGLESWLR